MTTERSDRTYPELFGSPPDERELGALQERLAARADDEGLLDVAYRTLDTPVGVLLLAATASGLVRIAYESEGLDAALAQLAGKISPRVLRAPRRLDDVARQLEEYFTGRRTTFDLLLDLRLATGFRRSVLAHLPTIGYGQTASYRSVAAAVHNPKAVRAVGTACATNPVPVVIPCHRVIRSDGRLGDYVGGADIKCQLQRLEAQR